MSQDHFDTDKKLDVSHVELSHTSSPTPATAVNTLYAKIQNPLADLTKDQLYANVDAFSAQHSFDQNLFRKAALLAQNPGTYDLLPELDAQDKEVVRREKTHRWSQPRAMYFLICVCSLGSAVQGWDNTGANGANLSFPQEFGIADRPWVVGVVNAAPGMIVGLFSVYLTDPLNKYLGRRGVLFLTGIFVCFPVLAQAFTQSWQQLLACRCLIGLGMGPKIATIPLFTSETAPANIRGALTMSFQLLVAFGIFFGFCSNLVFMDIGPRAWRYQLGAAFAPAVPMLVLIWFTAESPRWLMKKNRYPQAFNSFCRLRNSHLQAARDLYYAHCQIEAEQVLQRGSNYFSRVRNLFVIPRLQRATLASWIIMIAQQASGINVMAFYSSTIFAEAGYTTKQALLASFGFGLVNTIFAIPALFTIDRFGRRNLLLLTFPLMGIFLLLVGLMFKLPEGFGGRVPLIATMIYIYTALYSPGIGPVPFVYASEAFDLKHREVGISLGISVNNTIGAALGLVFPTMLEALGSTGAFLVFMGTCFIAWIVIFLGCPETAGRTLEELDYTFSVPASTFAKYQCGTWLPWFIKRWVFFQKNAYLAPLYDYSEVEGGTRVEGGGYH